MPSCGLHPGREALILQTLVPIVRMRCRRAETLPHVQCLLHLPVWLPRRQPREEHSSMTEAEAKETTAAPSPKKHGSPTKPPPAEKPKVGRVGLYSHPVSYPWPHPCGPAGGAT
jgi:hypothetical protein